MGDKPQVHLATMHTWDPCPCTGAGFARTDPAWHLSSVQCIAEGAHSDAAQALQL